MLIVSAKIAICRASIDVLPVALATVSAEKSLFVVLSLVLVAGP